MITADQLRRLYEKYLEIVHLEINELGVRPTEVRHLLGRLGEFHCALQLGGSLAHVANQQGFDVICRSGRRVSVKTTAQITGFVPIGKSTLNKADDLMIIQYRDGVLSTVYYGPIRTAADAARYYERDGKYELDIAKARRLPSSVQLRQPQ
ncbi:hypothetical protein N5F13_14955 [Comamonas thiooxydans]|uniref:DUF6998 domain-containing protein n=1 Tax=Comamonas thiooxydans TaxID=363952 RepID=UPI00244AC207|nr:hypothetical protein [Comamonas thiooxydans]MDH1475806.1 hypothetical protein [Comamonas thiooxydans]